MTINWAALGLVAAATIIGAIAIVGLFSVGVAALTAGHRSGDSGKRLSNIAGYTCLTVAGTIAVYGLYLIIPQFH